MTLIDPAKWPSLPVGALGKGTGVTWPYIEPRKGFFDWRRLDQWVRLARSHDVDFFYSNDLVPVWAAADPNTCRPTYHGSSVIGCSSTVADMSDWDAFVTALVTRYKGQIIYELWNEPYTHSFTGTLADMVALTAREYQIIRNIAPGAMILAPSGTPAYMDRYYAAGGPAGIDVLTFHSYRSDPEAIVKDAAAMKIIAAKYGLSAKPMWDTEGSWGSAHLTEDEQSAFVASSYLLLWSAGVSRFYWYAWDSPTFGRLLDAAKRPAPAAVAYRQIHHWMEGATLPSPCAIATDFTWTCEMTRPGHDRALAVWNSRKEVNFTPAKGYRSYFDLSGAKHPLEGSVHIGPKPILLVSAS